MYKYTVDSMDNPLESKLIAQINARAQQGYRLVSTSAVQLNSTLEFNQYRGDGAAKSEHRVFLFFEKEE